MEKIRRDFPALQQSIYGHPLVYLDSAATALKPRPMIEAVMAHYEKEAANVHRGIHYLSEKATLDYEMARQKAQRFINAPQAHDVIFTKGTTEAINLVASSFGLSHLKKGDCIMLSTMEHHSNIVPWQWAAERTGARVLEIPIDSCGDILMDEYEKQLSQKGEKVKMVAITHVSNTLGTINPIADMVQLAHKYGAKILVDGAQSVPHLKVDVQKLGLDFFAFSSHKAFGPTALGVLYGKSDLLEQMPPYQGGGGMVEQVDLQKTTYASLPNKFEAGTPPIAQAIGFAASLDYLEEDVGIDSIVAYEKGLLEYALKTLQDISGLNLHGTPKKRVPVFSFTMEGVHSHDVGVILNRQGIAVRTGHHCNQPLMKRLGLSATTRISLSFYNTKEEVDIFAQGIEKVKEFI